jgi:hypothetical protein
MHAKRASVEVDQIEATIRRTEDDRQRAPVAWRVRRWTFSILLAVVAFVFVIPLMNGDGAEAFDPSGYRLWLRVATAAILVIVLLTFGERRMAKQAADPATAARKLAQEYSIYTEPGWIGRTLILGVKLGLGVGVPIGVLVAMLPIYVTPTIVERIGSFLMFVGATMLWTLPMAFVIRWLSLRSMLRY